MYYFLLIILALMQSLLFGINKQIYTEWLFAEESIIINALSDYYNFNGDTFKKQYKSMVFNYKKSIRHHCVSASSALLEYSKDVAHMIGISPDSFSVIYDPELKCIAETVGSVIYLNSAIEKRPLKVILYILAHEIFHSINQDSFSLYLIAKYQNKDVNQLVNRYKRFLEIRADISTCLLGESYTKGMIDALVISASMNTGTNTWSDHPSLECRIALAEHITQDYTNELSEEGLRSFLAEFCLLY